LRALQEEFDLLGGNNAAQTTFLAEKMASLAEMAKARGLNQKFLDVSSDPPP
jgi:hypothetical protein